MFNDEYQKALSEWANAVLERERIVHHNTSLQFQGMVSSAQRQQRIDELEEENADLLVAYDELFNQFHQVEEDSNVLSEQLNEARTRGFAPMVRKILDKTKHKELHERNKEDARAKSAVMGYGRPVENRGLSTIKGGYGYNDTKQLNKGFMDFDDRKNDNYFTRPVM